MNYTNYTKVFLDCMIQVSVSLLLHSKFFWGERKCDFRVTVVWLWTAALRGICNRVSACWQRLNLDRTLHVMTTIELALCDDTQEYPEVQYHFPCKHSCFPIGIHTQCVDPVLDETTPYPDSEVRSLLMNVDVPSWLPHCACQ
jgi:hypothetical protein